MQLSQKEKNFVQFFAAFLKDRLNFEHFEKKKKKKNPNNFCISEITDSGYIKLGLYKSPVI